MMMLSYFRITVRTLFFYVFTKLDTKLNVETKRVIDGH